MNESTDVRWPVAELDPVRCLHVLAAAAGAVVVERVIPAPVEAVWSVASDLEREMPRLGWYVSSLHIVRADGDRLELVPRSRPARGHGRRADPGGDAIWRGRGSAASWRQCAASDRAVQPGSRARSYGTARVRRMMLHGVRSSDLSHPEHGLRRCRRGIRR